MNQRNSFIESLRFDVSAAYEEYSRYLFDYKAQFHLQALSAHIAIMEAFPELDFHTICRIKSLTSFLAKAEHKGIERVFDVHGMKHIIHFANGSDDEKLLTDYCYRLRDFLSKYYSELATKTTICRPKDYIVEPKENGYQALHFSGICGQRRFETQIKTARMEEVAKFGNANHAEKYKPRELGPHPLASVPRYLIIRNQDGMPITHELSLPDCFQYFYNIPYEQFVQMEREK